MFFHQGESRNLYSLQANRAHKIPGAQLKGVGWCSRVVPSPNHFTGHSISKTVPSCCTLHNHASEGLPKFLCLLSLLLTHAVPVGVSTLGTVFSAAEASSSASRVYTLHPCTGASKIITQRLKLTCHLPTGSLQQS